MGDFIASYRGWMKNIHVTILEWQEELRLSPMEILIWHIELQSLLSALCTAGKERQTNDLNCST